MGGRNAAPGVVRVKRRRVRSDAGRAAPGGFVRAPSMRRVKERRPRGAEGQGLYSYPAALREASALFPQLEPDGGGPEAAEELVEEGGGEQVAEAGRERVAGEDGAERTEGNGHAEAVAGVAVEGAVDRVGRQSVEEARVEAQAAVALLAHAGELEQPPP